MASESVDITANQRSATEAELSVANSGPAVLANRFYVSVGPQGPRIAFAEQITEQTLPVFRTAVIMSVQDGIALYKVLQGLLKESEAALQKSTSEHQLVQ